MLGVGLRKLCPLDSFGKAFREKKTVRKSTPEGAKPARGGAKGPFWKASGRLFCASCAQLGRQGRSEAVFGYLRPKLRYIGRFGALCRGTQGCRAPTQPTHLKSGQAKIPSKCSYMSIVIHIV